jgi:hypothetical protein
MTDPRLIFLDHIDTVEMQIEVKGKIVTNPTSYQVGGKNKTLVLTYKNDFVEMSPNRQKVIKFRSNEKDEFIRKWRSTGYDITIFDNNEKHEWIDSTNTASNSYKKRWGYPVYRDDIVEEWREALYLNVKIPQPNTAPAHK